MIRMYDTSRKSSKELKCLKMLSIMISKGKKKIFLILSRPFHSFSQR